MKLNHFAVASNSEEESKKFFGELLNLNKTRDFSVPSNLMEKFFDIKKEKRIIRYENENFAAEVFITEDKTKRKDMFTHVCLEVENKDLIVNKTKELGFKVIQVPRENREGYYLFIQDGFGNIYEIK